MVSVGFHSSQFPEQVKQDLLESLRLRQINHKFLYDSVRQTHQWLALHEACSPARTDPDCAKTYDRAFAGALARQPAAAIHLIGLGCGGGQKDARLLASLQESKKTVYYTATDVSSAMVLVAREAALRFIPPSRCSTMVCDLATATDLAETFDHYAVPDTARFITFFGMLPNFEPSRILPRLRSIVRSGDTLLLSANLAPGPDYTQGIQRVLPLYDNALTRNWLLGFLLELGVDPQDGSIQFRIEQPAAEGNLQRISAWFRFQRPRRLQVYGEEFSFGSADEVRLFFSYRHTVAKLATLLRAYGMQIVDQWITSSEEEGVFLVGPMG